MIIYRAEEVWGIYAEGLVRRYNDPCEELNENELLIINYCQILDMNSHQSIIQYFRDNYVSEFHALKNLKKVYEYARNIKTKEFSIGCVSKSILIFSIIGFIALTLLPSPPLMFLIILGFSFALQLYITIWTRQKYKNMAANFDLLKLAIRKFPEPSKQRFPIKAFDDRLSMMICEHLFHIEGELLD